MSSITIKLTGLEGLRSKIKNLSKEASNEIAAEFKAFGENTVRDAKEAAPVDEGHLRSSISSVTTVTPTNINTEIIVATDYAAYIEFGTKRFAEKYVATLPPDWKTFAAEFRGKGGGTVEQLLERLTAWVMRKGFAAYRTKSDNASKSKNSIQAQESAAYIIALRILQNGVRPHPFLFPAVKKNRKILIDNLNKRFPGK